MEAPSKLNWSFMWLNLNKNIAMNIIFHFCPYILQIGHLKERLWQTAFIWTYIHDWLWEKQYNSLYFASEKAWIKTISVFPNLDPNPFNVFWLSANFFLHEIGATQSKHDHTVSGSSMKSCHGYFFFIHSSAISHLLTLQRAMMSSFFIPGSNK